jgi:hypothetical protein
MRKSTVFISAVLTTFALAMLYGVVSAYRGATNVAEAAAVPTATSAPAATDIPAPTQVVITPESAAQLAARIIGNSNLLSAESSTINGVDAYKITFTNNDVVYVGLDGQILSVQVAPVVVNIAPPAQNITNKNNQNNVSSQGNHESYEEHDD